MPPERQPEKVKCLLNYNVKAKSERADTFLTAGPRPEKQEKCKKSLDDADGNRRPECLCFSAETGRHFL
jgi:hypothetical protein